MARRRTDSEKKQIPLFAPEQMPTFSGDKLWEIPEQRDWPDFKAHAKYIGVDTETNDPHLKKRGPGFIRGDANVAGISLASEDGVKLYLPIAHSEGNVDKTKAIEYIKYQLGGDQEKCGANLIYDIEALWSLGVEVSGKFNDVQICEPLIEEEKPGGYSLDNLALEYLDIGKNESLLREAAASFGLDPKADMHLMPSKYVGHYAEDDASHPIQIYLKQRKIMEEQDLLRVYGIEQRLLPVLWKMRLKGVRLDMDVIEQNILKVTADQDRLRSMIDLDCGLHINPSSPQDMVKALNAVGVRYPMTEKGNASITGDWLKAQDHGFCKKVAEWRKMNKMKHDFMETLQHENVNGRIHSNWHQVRKDDGDAKNGTTTGRIAASRFNLTQVPSRDPYWGPLIRSQFIADLGKLWGKADYSQQEPRIMLHYAVKRRFTGALEARQKYLENPNLDYHQLVADLILSVTGQDIGRGRSKTINLGSAYGMGKEKLANDLRLSRAEAELLLAAYHEGVPYVKEFEKEATAFAEMRGYVRTLFGRRRRFELFEPAIWGQTVVINHEEVPIIPLPRTEAQIRYAGYVLRRAKTQKALNAIVQGTAADQMKKALIDMDDQGICPQIQVYDEINGSFNNENEIRLMQSIMENAIHLEIPFVAEPTAGLSWGNTSALAT